MKSSKKLRRATKSNNGHQSWKNQNGQEKTKTSNEGHKKSKWKPGFIHDRTSLSWVLRSETQQKEVSDSFSIPDQVFTE